MAEAVYILCALTSAGCAVLLLRGYASGRSRLLFWSGLCFCGMAVNNGVLFLDLVIVPNVDLSMLRGIISLLSISVLLYGLVWESR